LKIEKESRRQFHPNAGETFKIFSEFKAYKLETTLVHVRFKYGETNNERSKK